MQKTVARRLMGFAVPLLLTACGETNTYVASPPPKVAVAPPVRRPVTRYFEATGYARKKPLAISSMWPSHWRWCWSI